MKVIKSTGLVPVKALVRFKQRPSGKVFGLEPNLVGPALLALEVELFPVPEDVETFEIPDPFPAPKAKDEPAAEGNGDDDGEVEIPADWEEMQWMKQAALAKAILGEDLPKIDGKTVAEVAREVIRQELERRAAEGNGDDANQHQ